jgi:hypothetical protein
MLTLANQLSRKPGLVRPLKTSVLALVAALTLLSASGCIKISNPDEDSSSPEEKQADASGADSEKSSCQGSSARFDLKVRGKHSGGQLTVTLNGFPVEKSTGIMQYSQRRAPLNTALVGEENHVAFRSEPLLMGTGGLMIGEHEELRGGVRCNATPVSGAKITAAAVDSAYRAWTDRARAKWRDYQSRNVRGALDSIRAWAEQNPMTVSTTFDNEAGPDFSRLFEEAPVIEGTPTDSARLKDYAMHLQSLLREKKGAALYREIRPAAEASARELGESPPPTSKRRARWRKDAENGEGWFDEKPPEFGRSDVGLDRWAEGRVWELYRRPGREPLLGGWNIFIAEVEGELKVVRLE